MVEILSDMEVSWYLTSLLQVGETLDYGTSFYKGKLPDVFEVSCDVMAQQTLKGILQYFAVFI